MLFQISNGTKFFGANDVFENINFEVNEKDKIALIGRNGSGKSTLLKVIMGKEDLTSGEVFSNSNLRVGYLSQSSFDDESITVQKAMDQAFLPILELEQQIRQITKMMETDHSSQLLEKYDRIHTKFEMLNGYNYQNELETILTKFGFRKEDLDKELSTFSGGQKTRLAFVRLLVSKPDILLLDEPTNHLDLSTIEWLEGYLKRYPNAIVLVSHDRTFIDNVVDVIYELEYNNLRRYVGNYTQYEVLKKNYLQRNQDAYNRQQIEIKKLEGLIEKFRYKATKASFAQSKIKQLDRIDKVELEKAPDDKSFKARFEPRVIGGKHVLEIDNLSVGYENVLCKFSLDIYRGDRIVIMGDNGTGKSTILKTLADKIPAISGNYLYGHQIEIGYFDQNLMEFDKSKTVLEEVWDEYPELDRTHIRTVLGNFLFTSDDVFKSVSVLSGGEKVRLALIKLMLKKPNLLILDEPTNHLDIPGKLALETALKDFEGTILFVSHDRYFINKIATSCMVIENGDVSHYPHGYQKSIDEKQTVTSKSEKVLRTNNTNKTKIRNIEIKINEYESQLEQMIAKRFDSNYYNDYIKMQKLEDDIKELELQIESLMEQWTTLHESE